MARPPGRVGRIGVCASYTRADMYVATEIDMSQQVPAHLRRSVPRRLAPWLMMIVGLGLSLVGMLAAAAAIVALIGDDALFSLISQDWLGVLENREKDPPEWVWVGLLVAAVVTAVGITMLLTALGWVTKRGAQRVAPVAGRALERRREKQALASGAQPQFPPPAAPHQLPPPAVPLGIDKAPVDGQARELY